MKKYMFLLFILFSSLVGCVQTSDSGFKFEKFEIYNKSSESVRYVSGDEIKLKFTFNVPVNKNIEIKEFHFENYGLFEFEPTNVFIQKGKTIAIYNFPLNEEYGAVKFRVIEFYYMDETLTKRSFTQGITHNNRDVDIEVERAKITTVKQNNFLYDNNEKMIKLINIEFNNSEDINVTKYMIGSVLHELNDAALINFNYRFVFDALVIEEWTQLKLFYESYPGEEDFVLINLFNQELAKLDDEKKVIYLEIDETIENKELVNSLDIGDANIYITNNKVFVVTSEVEVDEYNIVYNLDGGNFYGDVVNTYTIKDRIILKAPDKPGYTFVGWVGGSFNDPVLNAEIINEAGNKEFSAVWEGEKYVIYFHPEGGVIPHQIQEVTFGEQFVLTPAVRSGYTFLGWYYKNVEIENGIWEKYSGLSLTAKWQSIG